MSYSYNDQKRFRVIKDGEVTSDHRHAGQALTEAKLTGADEVHYLNPSGMGVTIWVRPVSESDMYPDVDNSYL